jgi:RND superfamily putative drug exporter
MNAVFGWGWGSSILGISGAAPVEVFLPVIMFSVLFGLSMDYEVFLVSRIHQQWVRTGDNRTAVTTGQAMTGRVITAAASIMILVFLSFLLNDNIIIQQFGIGLAAAVIIDAFVVRTILVPALMHLLGRANWWLPGWLDRWLPTLHIESERAAAGGSVLGPERLDELPGHKQQNGSRPVVLLDRDRPSVQAGTPGRRGAGGEPRAAGQDVPDRQHDA